MQILFGNNNDAIIVFDSRIDTVSAPEIEEQLDEQFKDHKDVKNLTFDFKNVEYISSIGLRLLLKWKKKMTSAGGEACLINPSEDIMEILSVTGFDELFLAKQT